MNVKLVDRHELYTKRDFIYRREDALEAKRSRSIYTLLRFIHVDRYVDTYVESGHPPTLRSERTHLPYSVTAVNYFLPKRA